jgi:hypothetical protein
VSRIDIEEGELTVDLDGRELTYISMAVAIETLPPVSAIIFQ